MSSDAQTSPETVAKASAPRRAALGRGLGALLGETRREEAVVRQAGETGAPVAALAGRADGGLVLLPVSQIEPRWPNSRRRSPRAA
jgi:ParB family chromosome partitioning protein